MNTMNILGHVRRVDMLGRVVLPKEMRHILHIKDEDPLELFLMDNGIFLKKYQPICTIDSLCGHYLTALSKNCKVACAITNTDFIIASKGINLPTEQLLSEKVQKRIRNLKAYEYSTEEPLNLFADGSYPIDALYPIGTQVTPAGAVILLHYRNTSMEEKCYGKFTATLLTELLNTN